ncbi:hypothetical protein GCM10018954_013050 [Kutzneria kofuensis]
MHITLHGSWFRQTGHVLREGRLTPGTGPSHAPIRRDPAAAFATPEGSSCQPSVGARLRIADFVRLRRRGHRCAEQHDHRASISEWAFALTPGRHWAATDPAEAVDKIIIGPWFGPARGRIELRHLTVGRVGECDQVGYRLQAGDQVVEQQAYYTARDNRIDTIRIVCSGYQPA